MFVRFTVVVAVLFTLPTTVIVTDAPGARLLNSVVTVFVEVLMTAEPLVELALVSVSWVGYVLRTTRVVAEVLPLLVTRTVKVKFWLTFAEVGLTEFVIAGLGVSVPVTVGVCGVPVTVAVRVEVGGVPVTVAVFVGVSGVPDTGRGARRGEADRRCQSVLVDGSDDQIGRDGLVDVRIRGSGIGIDCSAQSDCARSDHLDGVGGLRGSTQDASGIIDRSNAGR